MSEPVNLVIRLSAMGDVALTVPLVRSAALVNHLVVLTKPAFSGLFSNIKGVSVVTVDTGGRHKGIPGLLRLFR